MNGRLHRDLAEFTTLTQPLLQADPIRHNLALTALTLLPRMPDAAAHPPVLLSVYRAGVLAGAAVRLPPSDLIVSGLPAECAGAAVEVLAPSHQGLPGTVGPRSEAEGFARRWSARTGISAHERMAQRVFALGQLTPPRGVRGAPRQADADDLELLAQWREEFASEATGGLRGPGTARQQARGSLAVGTAALLWEIAGQPVAWASATAPVAGMSRIGPVYTPPRYRGHGYGSAVTAAAAGWARQAGAQHVVLFTDLANPVSNAIYPRIGFRPVHDAVEIAFTLPPERGSA
ncbi:MAG: GNAT family N-acetyltransferase [Pseudonocardiales bacterium]|nr:GNAT family N-acetyltransferase [Pseudonocardiales bacterium]